MSPDQTIVLFNKCTAGAAWCHGHFELCRLAKARSNIKATLLRLELIAAAMRQMPDFQTFLKDTKWERGMEPDDIRGIMIFAMSQNYAPV